jgi:adenine-specific DNA-methyltransferase
MNSLLEKEGMAEQVQVVYIDPPYGITYGSNFQPFLNDRDVTDGKDEDLTQEPETIKAFRDTWELEIHSYLGYLRDRFLLARELLSESGSIFVQISSANVHHVRELLSEIFGSENFISLIVYRTKNMTLESKLIGTVNDFIIWFAKNKTKVKYNKLYTETTTEGDSHYNLFELDGQLKEMTPEQVNDYKLLPKNATPCTLISLYPIGYSAERDFEINFLGRIFSPASGRSWKFNPEGFERLVKAGRIKPYKDGKTIRYLMKLSDFPVSPLHSLWHNTPPPSKKIFVVQTSNIPIQRCILMTTDPGDLVLDPTCGSGTTAFVSEMWGRRWITCDTSRVSITLAKQRITTALYSYYKMAVPEEGIDSGLSYKKAPHITLESIANDEPSAEVTLYDEPYIDKTRARVSGPFTVEAVPSFNVKPLSELEDTTTNDESISRSGETLRQIQWREELLKTGIRAKTGSILKFSRIETLPGTRWLHADAETLEENPQRVVVSFGPEYAPLEQRQVELAIKEAEKLVPAPTMVAFAAFQFDPEAAKDIDQTQWPNVTLVKVQMNTDLLTEDLKKNRASNESFWFIGQPDAELIKLNEGQHAGKYQAKVAGFDYYDPRTGTIESGGLNKIVMWMLDTDYDGRSIYPRQVFFPMENKDLDWTKIAKNLRAEIDEELIEAYRGDTSLPFEAGENKQVAIKIVDDRGIESLKIIEVM